MKVTHKVSLALAVSAAVASLAFARTLDPQDPVVRLAAVEKEVAALKAEVATLRAAVAAAGDQGAMQAELAQTRDTLDKVLTWSHAQAQAAAALQASLEDARDKGFVAGINPDSRDVLLQGFRTLAESLRTELPAPLPPKSGEKPADKANDKGASDKPASDKAAPAAKAPAKPAPAPAPKSKPKDV